ncbi:hypothetical protein P9112_006061 [Eukaryota sp. TZLM1-RC]
MKFNQVVMNFIVFIEFTLLLVFATCQIDGEHGIVRYDLLHGTGFWKGLEQDFHKQKLINEYQDRSTLIFRDGTITGHMIVQQEGWGIMGEVNANGDVSMRLHKTSSPGFIRMSGKLAIDREEPNDLLLVLEWHDWTDSWSSGIPYQMVIELRKENWRDAYTLNGMCPDGSYCKINHTPPTCKGTDLSCFKLCLNPLQLKRRFTQLTVDQAHVTGRWEGDIDIGQKKYVLGQYMRANLQLTNGTIETLEGKTTWWMLDPVTRRYFTDWAATGTVSDEGIVDMELTRSDVAYRLKGSIIGDPKKDNNLIMTLIAEKSLFKVELRLSNWCLWYSLPCPTESYCKWWQSIPVCHGNDELCSGPHRDEFLPDWEVGFT